MFHLPLFISKAFAICSTFPWYASHPKGFLSQLQLRSAIGTAQGTDCRGPQGDRDVLIRPAAGHTPVWKAALPLTIAPISL